MRTFLGAMRRGWYSGEQLTRNENTAQRIEIVAAMALSLLVASVGHAIDDKATFVMGGTLTAGNAIYEVHVQDVPGTGVGLYTATTGPAHPAGSGLNVLFGDGSPGTTFNTIRSYTTGTDYVQSPGKSSVNAVVFLDSFGTVNAIGTTGVRTTYMLPGSPTTPDALTVVSDVNVNGTTIADSTIEVTTTVINNGPQSVDIGIRYLWDFQVGADDGPTFQPINPDGAVLITEAEFIAPSFQSYRIVDNDTNPSPPTFVILGTVTGPSLLVPRPTAPSLLQNVCWPDAFATAFEYTVNPLRDIATTASDCRGFAGGDIAVNYFFGHDRANAVTIQPSGTFTASASLFLTAPSVRCGDGVVNQPSEQCDGSDDAACPGRCLADCTCPRNTPPDCSGAVASRSVLWPPNHQFESVSIQGVTDADGDAVALSITSITQDEPLNTLGDGNTCPDATGVGSPTAMLRAERAGTPKVPGDGRVYHVSFTASDGKGGECSGTVQVCVPHDQGRGHACVDEGPLVDSTGPCR